MIAWLAIVAVAMAADRDGDGIKGHDDLCPRDAETMNGFKDGDGCPDGGTVRVRVVDGDGKPVAGATITVERPKPPFGASTGRSTTPVVPRGSGPYATEAIRGQPTADGPTTQDRGFTDPAGAWTATGLAPGARVVIATAGGHGGRRDIEVSDGATVDVIVSVGP